MKSSMIAFFVLSALLIGGAALAADYSLDVHEQGKAFEGTTVFAETRDPKRPRIVEVDMEGNVVWEYEIPPNIVRGGRPGQALDVDHIPETDTFLFVMPFKGIFEINRDREIVWKHLTRTVSHDADRLPNGNTLYTFAWERESDPEVFEITPEGEIVWEWRAIDHIDPSERRHKGSVERDGFCHVNGATRLPNGNTRISIRNFSRAVEVDADGNVVWTLNRMMNGKEVKHIHDPQDLPNGNLVVSMHGPQILFVLTRDGRMVHRLRKPDIHLVRTHQVLPNGNILATDVDKIMELTPDLSTVVWQLSKPGVDMSAMGQNTGHGKRPGGQGKADPRECGFFKAERIPAK